MTDNFPAEKSTDSVLTQETSINTAQPKVKPQKENMLVNILMNIVIPTLILTKASGDDYLGATWGLIVALAFPIGYGLKDFIARRKFNFFSALGVVSVLLTGGISLLHLD
ncbi:MAG: MFS transporter, partial [Moraxellaceae bacterium]